MADRLGGLPAVTTAFLGPGHMTCRLGWATLAAMVDCRGAGEVTRDERKALLGLLILGLLTWLPSLAIPLYGDDWDLHNLPISSAYR